MPERDLQVRWAAAGDDRDLAALDATAWPAEFRVAPAMDAADPFFGPRRRVEDVLVADIGARLAGYAHLVHHSTMPVNRHVLHLNALVVDPAARGAGAGTALVAGVVGAARARGARKLGLRVLATNRRAIELYERLGFVQEGRLVAEFHLADGSYVDDLWYAVDLVGNR